KVTFFQDKSTEKFSSFWKLDNVSKNQVVLDSAKYYIFNSGQVDVKLTDGFIVKLEDQEPLLDKLVASTSSKWYNEDTSKTFYSYLSKNIKDGRTLAKAPGTIANLNTAIVSALDLRNVELRFGEQGKAYRYLVGYVGANPPARRNSYIYAEGVTEANPSIPPSFYPQLALIGKLGEGFVDVPFTAWVKDDSYGEMQQLAVGFLERAAGDGGNPDGVWDPGVNIETTAEYIFIFNAPYDPNGNQQEYKGNFPASTQVWADLKGYTIPVDANATQEQRDIALSPYFNTLYAFSTQRKDSASFYSAGDKFTFPVKTYPYTSFDEFEFSTTVDGALTEEQERALFDKVNVFPNPMYGYNPYTAYSGLAADDPFVTFTNLPNEEVTIKIYSLSGQLLRTLVKDPTSSSPFVSWNLLNESGLRVASGLYLAIVSSPKYGDKVLKFSIIMPQKQLPRF
ncbi:MAG: hypothetical protein RBR74_10385, partial [Ignavibacteriaceae bacterium]|nr:hypothetical protein [Ignavibacteriaceae bacterium]